MQSILGGLEHTPLEKPTFKSSNNKNKVGFITLLIVEKLFHIVWWCNWVNDQTSQLTGKAYEDSDYTVVITVMHWSKCIIIVQKLTSEIWALLSSHCFVLPLLIAV